MAHIIAKGRPLITTKPDWEEKFDKEFYEGEENSVTVKCVLHKSYATPFEFKAFISKTIAAELEKERERAAQVVFLILPLAKGYVVKNNGGANSRYIEIAEKFLESTQNKPKEERE